MDEKLEWLYKLYDPKEKGEITWDRLFYVITSMDDLMGEQISFNDTSNIKSLVNVQADTQGPTIQGIISAKEQTRFLR
uniref:EF-hand domain-containing protein n=1 Tax=Caenorhabditis japonica TaxID=281687 RepID=A0A8R1DMS9_CAEJA